MLAWFDENPGSYAWVAGLVLAAAVAVALRSFFRSEADDKPQSSDWIWGLFIYGVLVAARWPGFLRTREYNPDESQLIAGAMTLRHDPLFWRSVDGGTAGPFDFYALHPAGWLLGSDSYLSARVTALALIGGALLLVHQVLVHFFGRSAARATTLGAVVFEACSLHPDFLHYSTELVPVFLLAAATYVGWVTLSRHASSVIPTLAAGAILGSVPLAKLQAAPVAAAIGLWLVVTTALSTAQPWIVRRRRVAALLAGAVAPVAVWAALLGLAGEWRHAITPYLQYNLSYVGAAYFGGAQWRAGLWTELEKPGTLYLAWLGGTAAGILLATACLLRVQGRMRHPLFFFSLGFFALSLACIYFPQRPFAHYLQFSVVPATLLLGAMLGMAVQATAAAKGSSRALFLSLTLLVTLLPSILIRLPVPHPDIGRLRLFQSSPRGVVARELLRYAQPGESLGLWGWNTNFYVEAGLWQASRDAFSQAEILEGPFQGYFRRRYLADVILNRPPVFIDTTEGGRSTFPTQPLAAEQIFPELAVFLRQNYTRLPDVSYVHLYVRNDRLGPRAR